MSKTRKNLPEENREHNQPGSPEAVLNKLWSRVSRGSKAAALGAVFGALAAHVYMLTNKFPNHDDLSVTFFHSGEATQYVMTGRWFLAPAIRLFGGSSMPWLIGLVSILLLGVSAVLVCRCLKIEKPLYCALAGAVMAVFPAVTSTLTYMFTAGAYFAALALSCLAAFIASRGRKLWPVAAALLTLSMGIYQAYFPMTATLLMISLVLDILRREESFREFSMRALRYLLTLVSALAAYLIIVRITTLKTGMLDYQGLSSMGDLSISGMLRGVLHAYDDTAGIYFGGDYGIGSGALTAAAILSAFASFVLAAFGVSARRQRWKLSAVVFWVLMCMLPLCCGLMRVMAPTMASSSIVIYPMCLLAILPAALLEAVGEPRGEAGLYRRMAAWVTAASMAIFIWCWSAAANDTYLRMDLAFSQAQSVVLRVLSRAEETPGYTDGMQIVLVGRAQLNENTVSDGDLTGTMHLDSYLNVYSIEKLAQYYVGTDSSVSNMPLSDPIVSAAGADRLACFPESGCSAVVDGRCFVRIGN